MSITLNVCWQPSGGHCMGETVLQMSSSPQQTGRWVLQVAHEPAGLHSVARKALRLLAVSQEPLDAQLYGHSLISMYRSAENCVAILQPSSPRPSTSTSESSRALCQR